jgi:hypothetical protein
MKAQETTAAPIEVEEAVRLAKEFATRIYESEKISRLGLEAVERSDDRRYWLVTLGFFAAVVLSPDARLRFTPD